LQETNPEAGAIGLSPQNLAYIIYTSGSTGQPKGVMIEHGNVVPLVKGADYVHLGPDTVILAGSTLAFDASTFDVWGALANGGKCILIDRNVLLSPTGYREALVSHGVTTVFVTTALFNQFALENPGMWQGLEEVFFGGEDVNTTVVHDVLPVAPQRLVHIYGPTEATTFSIAYAVSPELPADGHVPIGCPLSNNRVYILDTAMAPVPVGVTGEIYIGGEGVARGYLNRPELTAERFVQSPFLPGDRLYKTGDLARYLPDGNIEFQGRNDFQVKIRGFRIELGEIEAKLAEHPSVRNAVVVARQEEDGGKRLVAYIVPEPLQAAEDLEQDALAGEFVNQWETLFDDTYTKGFNAPSFVGWNSSYTGEPIPEAEMKQWAASTIQRISALEPSSIMEIGCGTGLLLQHLAPKAREYVATDFSAPVIENLANWAAGKDDLRHVEFSQCEASEFDGLTGRKFDAIVLNSIVQYFPSMDYLIKVIEGSIGLMNDGGAIFVGDVRNFDLLEVFHASVQYHKAPDEIDGLRLKWQAERAVSNDKELTISPDFFMALQQWIPAISSVEILLKRGGTDNELTKYRYDVVLHINGACASDVEVREWDLQQEPLETLGDVLGGERPAVVRIAHVPNRRLLQDIMLRQVVMAAEPDDRKADLLERKVSPLSGDHEPETFWQLGERHGYEVRASWSPGAADHFDVVLFDRKQLSGQPPEFWPAERLQEPLSNYGNNLFMLPGNKDLVHQLYEHLQQKLPEYMLPSATVLLDSLPITTNGKLNRAALPAPEGRPHGLTWVAPRTPTEEVLVEIWSVVLKVDRVGITDDFFALGGHSLLAVRVIARIRDLLGVELPLRSVFEAPTIEQLAITFSELQREGAWLSVPCLEVVQDRPDVVPLSYAQERLWFLDQMSMIDAAYNMPMGRRIEGALDVEALRASMDEILRRHEALRTRFILVGGEPMQVIDPPSPFDFEKIDLSHLSVPARENRARELVQADFERGFDLECGPLLRAMLLQLTTEQHVLFVNLHHIISDGWSLGILKQELGLLYEAFSQGRSSPLADLPAQYADYALWQRGWLQGDALERQLAYWREQLRDAPPGLELPTDRPRPATASFKGGTVRVSFPRKLTDQLVDLTRNRGATLYMLLLAAFQVVLGRWSGQEDIIVGSPIAGRTDRKLDQLIGFFVNTLALRTDLSGNPTFLELLDRVKETTLEAYTHQDLPFEKLVAELQPVRDLSRHPIFQVMFALQNAPDEGLDLPGLMLDDFGTRGITSKFDIFVSLTERPTGLEGFVEYASDIFDGATIERLLGHMRQVLEQVVTAPSCRLDELDLLTEEEREQLLIEWNATASDYPRDACIHELFEQQVVRAPQAVALIFEDISLSYGELNQRANRLAHYLSANGIGPDCHVAICLKRSPEMLVGLLAILKAGGCYVPLDPDYPIERLRYMIDDSAPAVLLCDPTTQPLLADVFAQVAQPPRVVDLEAMQSEWADLQETNPEAGAIGLSPQNLAYIIYTSGSTGQPKGVMIEHGNVVNYICSQIEQLDLGTVDLIGAVTTISFDIAVTELYCPLTTGAGVNLVSAECARDGKALASEIETNNVTILQATPNTWRLLLDHLPEDYRLKALVGGESIDSGLYGSLVGRNLEFWNVYGPTETTVWSTAFRGSSEFPPPVGRPLANTRVYILDTAMAPVPVGVTGEIYIGGEGVARGYLNRPELTAEHFVQSPFMRGDRLYKTGDLARYLPDGDIEFLGRNDFQVKIRGFRIELGEIEAKLAEHPSVRDAVVVAQQEKDGDKRLVAYHTIMPDSESEPDTEALRTWLAQELPRHMVPVVYVRLRKLPLTLNGKVDRKALPAPDSWQPDSNHVAPETATEAILMEIWAAVLKLDQVGVTDDFFALGGHSMLATQIIARANQELDVEIALNLIFRFPTIRALASLIDRGGKHQIPQESNDRYEECVI